MQVAGLVHFPPKVVHSDSSTKVAVETDDVADELEEAVVEVVEAELVVSLDVSLSDEEDVGGPWAELDAKLVVGWV